MKFFFFLCFLVCLEAQNPQVIQLNDIIRDFRAHQPPDFEGTIGDDRGIVTNTIGPNRKPVKKTDGPTLTVQSRETFDKVFQNN